MSSLKGPSLNGPSLNGPSLNDGLACDRRDALKLLAAGAAAALSGCSRPDEEIIPYVEMPEGRAAGELSRYATTLTLAGYGRGFLAIAVDGRPIKIEGNPRHPFSLGATDIFAEAEILSLYDPDRARVVRRAGQISDWGSFAAAWRGVAGALAAKNGAGLAVVSGRIVSPTTLARIDALRARFPELRWYRYEPVNDDAAREGSRLAFGKMLSALPRLGEADVIVSLGADPLGPGPEQLRNARAFASRRAGTRRQHIYAMEPVWSLTGAAADNRMALSPEDIAEVARLVANALGANLGTPALSPSATAFAERAAHDLMAARGRALMLAGETQPAAVHALIHWINERLGAPLDLIDPVDPVAADHATELTSLAADLHAGRVTALVVLDANPVYDAPDSLGIAAALSRVQFTAHLGLAPNETAALCGWTLPLSHALESWGDARAPDSVASIAQPLIRRLYDTRTCDEVLSLLAGEVQSPAYEQVRETWRAHANGNFERWWRGALQDGLIAGTARNPVQATAALPASLAPRQPATGITLIAGPDPCVWDGRYANNAWLQECPRPFTKEVWGNAVQMSANDAKRLGIADQAAIEFSFAGAIVAGTAVIVPGQADGVIAVTWGQGRTKAGAIGTGVGNRYIGLGASPFARVLPNVTVRAGGHEAQFHSTQGHTQLEGAAEELFKTATPASLAASRAEAPAPASLLPIPAHGDYAWAMAIDTDACIGCNACVVACQAENNIPVVGPEEIDIGRDMHWLRVDTYVLGESENPRRGFQPVPCMHCELAPCEPVCPVAASVHDHEGLNVQVYNRCIGTRFCEANCPYKVRRFNWYAYAGTQGYANQAQPPMMAHYNPDVSVRPRGVMEKCNYCLQRVSRARRQAEKENRTVAEGEMVTACQAACPTRAIHFGDLNRAESEVSRLRKDARHYTLLEQLNTRPRTTYLKRIYDEEPG